MTEKMFKGLKLKNFKQGLVKHYHKWLFTERPVSTAYFTETGRASPPPTPPNSSWRGYSGVRSRVLFARLALCEKTTSDFKITFQVVTYQCKMAPQNKSLVAGFFGGGGVRGVGEWGWVEKYVQEQVFTRLPINSIYGALRDSERLSMSMSK